jgi:hypothetical protein
LGNTLIRWRGKDLGRWVEQEPLFTDPEWITKARAAVAEEFDKLKTPEEQLGMVARTYAEKAAEKHGLWPPPGVTTGFDLVIASYILYMPIQLLTADGKWKTYKGLAKNDRKFR